jgi:hypothetical protein
MATLADRPFSADISLAVILETMNSGIHAICWGLGLVPALTVQRLLKRLLTREERAAHKAAVGEVASMDSAASWCTNIAAVSMRYRS